MYPTFFETRAFTEQWAGLELGDAELNALQQMLGERPEVGRVVPESGGLRKVRFALPGQGKRGGCRVYYAVRNEGLVFVLAVAFGKNEVADISPAARRVIAAAVERIIHRRRL